jgi:hypothetical protein
VSEVESELDELRRRLAAVDQELQRAEREPDADLPLLREQREALAAQIEREQEARKLERAWSPHEIDQDLERGLDR